MMESSGKVFSINELLLSIMFLGCFNILEGVTCPEASFSRIYTDVKSYCSFLTEYESSFILWNLSIVLEINWIFYNENSMRLANVISLISVAFSLMFKGTSDII